MPFQKMNVEPEVFKRTPCDRNYACLTEEAVCKVESFIDRDVQILRCRDERACVYRKNYQGMFICTCPVNKAAFNLY